MVKVDYTIANLHINHELNKNERWKAIVYLTIYPFALV